MYIRNIKSVLLTGIFDFPIPNFEISVTFELSLAVEKCACSKEPEVLNLHQAAENKIKFPYS